MIAYCRIFPGIGIARVGNSPDKYFIGPEAPGHSAQAPGGFKDDKGRVKRQVARFRIYGYDDKGNVQELTAAEADITWTVHLANKKASWFQFEGAAAEAAANQGGTPLPLRNADIVNTTENPRARQALEIDPGPRQVSGVNAGGPGTRFDTGSFLGKPVPLGEIRTDEAGRLLVFGGFGTSESVIDDNPIIDYANNDRWHDDVSDGPVTARVVLKSGGEVPVREAAWVIVAPPDFAPGVDNLVTLYGVLNEVAVNQGWITPPTNVSFTRDIYPILLRATGYQWVNAFSLRGHGPGRPGNFVDPLVLPTLADKTEANRMARHAVFDRIRNPNADAATSRAQANLMFMPQLSGDEGYITEGDPSTWFTVLKSQYAMLKQWADGDFDADWPSQPPAPPPLFAQIPAADQPAALDHAALEHCVGGPFLPGIEMTYISRDPSLYSGPFRLRSGLAAGDITKRMAVPWQADFYECRLHWWPSQRPDDVITEQQYQKILDGFAGQSVDDRAGFDLANLLLDRSPWARGIGDRIKYQGDALQRVLDNNTRGDNDMADSWSQLGFVVPRVTPNAGTVLIETERDPYAGLKDRDYFYHMLNLDQFTDFLPKARELADAFLCQAEELLRNPTDDEMPFFEYTPEAFTGRLEQIYNDLVVYAASYDPTTDTLFKSRDDLIERIRQLAPFNQTDGAWLRNITQAGPITEVHALLFSIWMDEVGNGDPALNHANLYSDLLHSVGIYLEDINTRAYADNPDLLDSAFTVPLLELVLSQFSQIYFPELLGMTLNLEWEVVGLKPIIKLFESFGLNAQFYKMHVGIDNAVNGHGGKAKRAVEIYLDHIRAESGEVEMQAQWRRIWRGYTAFKYLGSLFSDLTNKLAKPPTPTQQVYAMVRRKAPYARLNHNDKRIGPNFLNDWFDDIPGLIGRVDSDGKYTPGALVTGGYIIPGDPDHSPFFNLLKFTGPMYKVFNDDEIKLWERWVRSIGPQAPPPPPPADPGAAMSKLIDLMRDRQSGTPGHATNSLAGPDPDHPGQDVTNTVARWFDGTPTPAFMQALANEENGWVVKGNAGASRFVTELLSGDHPMARALGEQRPELGNKTGREVAIAWINAGCPIPGAPRDLAGEVRRLREEAHAAGRRLRRLMLDSPASEILSQPGGRLLGNGTIH